MTDYGLIDKREQYSGPHKRARTPARPVATQLNLRIVPGGYIVNHSAGKTQPFFATAKALEDARGQNPCNIRAAKGAVQAIFPTEDGMQAFLAMTAPHGIEHTTQKGRGRPHAVIADA